MAIERHMHLPGPRKNLRVFDRHFIIQSIATDASITLDDVQRVTMEVAGTVKPGLVVETVDIDDKRVPFPMTNGPSHPGINRTALLLAVHVDGPVRVGEFIRNKN